MLARYLPASAANDVETGGLFDKVFSLIFIAL